MKQIYLAADGGGSKLSLTALDKNGRTLTTVTVNGGTNRKTTAVLRVSEIVTSALDAVRDQIGEFEVMHCAGYLMHNNDIYERLTGAKVTELDEGTIGLLAAGIDGDGVLILSGTGADAYFIRGGKTEDIIGGYGAYLGDPGSGFAIGRAAINAAIASYEGRGEKTLLEELLVQKYPAATFRGSVYGIYGTDQTFRSIADFCPECEAAADQGDEVAKKIFREAALELCNFAVAGYKKLNFDRNTPYTFSGGVITHDIRRQNPLMERYIVKVLSNHGINNYVKPSYPPVFGAVRWIKKTFIK